MKHYRLKAGKVLNFKHISSLLCIYFLKICRTVPVNLSDLILIWKTKKMKKNSETQKLYCPWWGRISPLCPVCLQQLSMTFHSLGYLQVYSMNYRDVKAELCQWILSIHLPCIRFMWGLRFKCQGSDQKVIPDISAFTVVWCETEISKSTLV